MSVQLPDFTALGTVNPQPSGQLPAFAPNDPVAEGEATLGKGIAAAGKTAETIGAYSQIAKGRLEQALATTDLFNRLTPLHEQISKETDPARLAELRGQYDTLLDTSGQAIADPAARQLWQATHSKTIAQAHADADARNTVLDRNGAVAKIAMQLDQTARTGAMADDPQAFANAKLAIGNTIEWGQNYGALLPEQGYALQKKATTDLVAGRIDSLVAKGRPDEASSLLNEYRADLGAVAAANLEARIESKGADVRSYGAAVRALGGASPASPGTPGQHINYGATGALGDPTQPGWGEQNLTAVTAPSGASFQVHKAAAADFSGFLKDLEATGYKINANESGGHNLREMRGGSQLSEHAYGTAIDINSSRNPYSKTGEKITDLPANVAELAAKHNLEWGGNWTSPVDTMHFQWRGPNGGGTASAGAPDRVDNWETRNNNFGGIRKVGADPNATTTQGGFESYATPQEGVAAIASKLSQYAAGGVVTATNPTGAPLNTVRGIVSTWAPPGQNNTDLLIARASQVTGFGPDQPLNLADPAVMGKMVEATIRNEQGGKLPVSPAVIQKVTGASSAGPIQTNVAGAQPTAIPTDISGATPQLAQSPPNRSGLPMPDDMLRSIQADPTLRNDKERAQAFAHAEQIYRTQEAALAQNERIATQQAQGRMRDAENEIFTDVYSGQPKITPQQVATDPRFNINPERRKAMIELINNPPGSGVPAAQSYAAAQSLIERIRAPEGDPNRINSEDQIYDQMRSLNRTDLEFVLKKFNDIRSPGGEKFSQREAQFIKGIEAQIDKSNPIQGDIDQSGKQKLYEFQWTLDQKVAEYRKAGKDPNDLLNPAKPEYMGNPKELEPFQKSMEESSADVARKYAPKPAPTFKGPVGSTPIPGGIEVPIPAIPASPIQPRKPGETIDDYMRRVH